MAFGRVYLLSRRWARCICGGVEAAMRGRGGGETLKLRWESGWWGSAIWLVKNEGPERCGRAELRLVAWALWCACETRRFKGSDARSALSFCSAPKGTARRFAVL